MNIKSTIICHSVLWVLLIVGLLTSSCYVKRGFPTISIESEILAIEATGEFSAPLDVNRRVLSELEAIRAIYPEVKDIHPLPQWVMRDLIIVFDDNGAAAFHEETYTAWGDLNSQFGVVEIDETVFDTGDSVVLIFSTNLNIPLLAVEYAELPGIRFAEPNVIMADGNDVCLTIEGDLYVYIFDSGFGDCTAGCIYHRYWGFSTDPSGNLKSLGKWNPQEEEMPPEWFEERPDCTQWL